MTHFVLETYSLLVYTVLSLTVTLNYTVLRTQYANCHLQVDKMACVIMVTVRRRDVY